MTDRNAPIRALTNAIREHVPALIAALRGRDDVAALAGPEPVTARMVGLEHLGRWVSIPGRPPAQGPRAVAEPSVIVQAGRLVGIRPGTFGNNGEHDTRTLVILQGPATAALTIRVDDRVDIAPREWN